MVIFFSVVEFILLLLLLFNNNVNLIKSFCFSSLFMLSKQLFLISGFSLLNSAILLKNKLNCVIILLF
jgi:hypothetical protein